MTTGKGATTSSSNYYTVSFSFAPTFIILKWSREWADSPCPAIYVPIVGTSFATYNSTYGFWQNGTSISIKKSSDSKTFYWYSDSSDINAHGSMDNSSSYHMYLAMA